MGRLLKNYNVVYCNVAQASKSEQKYNKKSYKFW